MHSILLVNTALIAAICVTKDTVESTIRYALKAREKN